MINASTLFFRLNLYNGAQNTYFLEVLDVVPFAHNRLPNTIHEGEGRNMSMYDSITLHETAVRDMLQILVTHADGSVGICDDFFTKFCSQYGLPHTVPTGCLQLPHPVGLLVAHHHWQFVGLSWDRKIHNRSPQLPFFKQLRDFRPQMEVSQSNHNEEDGEVAEEEVEEGIYRHTVFFDLMNHVRKLLGHARDYLSQEELENVESETLSWLGWLDKLRTAHTPDEFIRCAWEKTPGRGGHFRPFEGHGRWRGDFLVANMRIALTSLMTITSDGTAHTQIKRQMMYMLDLFPRNLKDSLREAVSSAALPSRAVLQRAKLWLDVTFMRIKCAEHEELVKSKAVIFPMWDSTPTTANRNMLMFQYSAIKGCDLPALGRAALEMRRFPKKQPFSEDTVTVSEMNAELIRQKVQKHRMVPMQMGQKRSGMPHKVACALQSCWVENYSWQLTADFIKLFFVGTTDGGTEKAFNQNKLCSPYTYFSWWKSQTPPVEGAEFAAAPVVDDDPVLDFTRMMNFKGLFHFVEKLQKRLLSELPCWPQLKPFYDSLCIYFHNDSTRMEYVQLGLKSDSTYEALTYLFEEGGPPKLQGGRVWTVLTQANTWWEGRYTIVQATWPFHADELGGDNGEDIADEELGRHRSVITQNLRDVEQEGRLILVRVLQDFIQHIECWIRACPCHTTEMVEQLWPNKIFDCPLAGLRVVDVCAGQLHVLLDEAASLHHRRLNAKLPRGLTESQRGRIIQHFFVVKGHVVSYALVAAQPFLKIPIRSLGLGHHDHKIALAVGASCILQYDALSIEEAVNAHPRSIEMFAPGSEFRAELTRNISEGQLVEEDDDNVVFRFRCKALYAAADESPIERSHAEGTQNICKAPHHTNAFFSCMSRKAEIMRRLSSVGGISSFVSLWPSCATAADCLNTLQMQYHQAVVHSLNDRQQVAPKFPDRIAVRVIYRGDVPTQFEHLPDARIPKHGNRGDDDAGGPDGGDKGSDDESSGTSSSSSSSSSSSGAPGAAAAAPTAAMLLSSTIADGMFAHWRKLMGVGKVYSIALRAPEAFFSTASRIQSITAPVTRLVADDIASVSDIGIAVLAMALNSKHTHDSDIGMISVLGADAGAKKYLTTMSGRHQAFFRVSYKCPSALERENAEADKLNDAFSSSHSIIEHLRPVFANVPEKTMVLMHHGEQYNVDMKLLMSTGSSFMEWQQKGGPHYCSPELLNAQSQRSKSIADYAKSALELNILGALSADVVVEDDNDDIGEDDDALIECHSNLFVPADDHEYLDAVKTLVDLGLARKVSDDVGGAHFAITAKGVSRSEPCFLAAGIVMQDVCLHEDPRQMTLLELLHTLKQHKWQPMLANTKDLRKKARDATAKGPKVFYFQSFKPILKSLYLKALVMLAQSKIEGPVPHFANSDVYKQLLGIKRRRKGRPSWRQRHKGSVLELDHAVPETRKRGLVTLNPYEGNFTWNGARFTLHRTVPHRKWAVTCPLSGTAHKSLFSQGNRCKRTLAFSDPVTEAAVLHELKWWLCCGRQCHNRKDHQDLKIKPEDIRDDILADPVGDHKFDGNSKTSLKKADPKKKKAVAKKGAS